MGHLWGSQSHFDKNGDGHLNSREYTNWYMETYGTDMELAERKRAQKIKTNWSAWLNKTLPIVESAYAIVLDNAKQLIGNDVNNGAGKAFLYMITCGLIEGKTWDYHKVTSTGLFFGGSKIYPYRSVIEAFLRRHPELASYAVLEREMRNGNPLYSTEGQLTNQHCGLFWRRLIPELPTYHEDALPELCSTGVYVKYKDEESAEKVQCLQDIMEAMFPMYTFFSCKVEEEADIEINKLRNVFETHWEYISSGAETNF